MTVATREGGVDRNSTSKLLTPLQSTSPPARVAWIETFSRAFVGPILHHVATREGGVDRNDQPKHCTRPGVQSPPARVAWIETLLPVFAFQSL